MYGMYEEKEIEMSKHSSAFNTIPSVLSIPEKLNAWIRKLLGLRFPVERHFSGRDLLLTACAGLVLLLSVLIRALAPLRLYACVLAALAAAVPLALQGYGMIRQKKAPLEECTWLLSTLLAMLIGETTAAPLILIFANLLMQAEAYSLLHRDAATDYLADSDLKLRHAVETADTEKSPERRILASVSLGFYVLYVLIALVFAGCALLHVTDYRIWLHRALVFLVLSSPSAVLFSSLLTHFGAIYSASKAGILYDSNVTPEEFARCRLFAFSKTGTVTDGRFIVSEIAPVGVSEEELLRIAAVAECRSDHPIAMTLKAAAGLREGVVPQGVLETREIPGKGVSTFFSGHHIYVGNAGLLEENGIWYQIPAKTGSAIHVAVDSTYRGYLMVSDALRENAFEALEELRALGISTLVMLTGDVRSSARTLASSLNFDMVKPELSPEEKGSAIRYLRSAHGDRARIACVGDGFHDADMFREADISVCLEPKAEAPGADVSIFSDEIGRIPLAFRICRTTERTLLINSAVLLGVKLLLGVLGAAAVFQTGLVAALDFGFGAAATVYALTCLTLEKRGG